jgi:hypothetical protein
MYLSFWHWVDGGDGVFFMAALSARKHHPTNSNSSFNVLNLKTRRDKRSWINRNVRHFTHILQSSGGQRGRFAGVYCLSRRRRGRGIEMTVPSSRGKRSLKDDAILGVILGL